MKTGPLVAGALLVLGAAIVVSLLAALVGMPQAAFGRLALVLSLSGAGSLLVGAALVRLVGGRIGSLRRRVALANGVGMLMALVNVLVASSLMFMDSQDVGLFALLLAFAAVISLAFGYSVASALMGEIELLDRAAARLAGGDLDARAGPVGSGEVARLAETFDSMAARVQAAFTRERELEASRRQLLAALSHDLRTPLATTRAMVEAIAEGVVSDSDEVRHYLRVIRGEVQHLSRLIDDLFELSQIESGAFELQCVPTSLLELVSETLAAYQAQVRERGVTLERRVAADLPPVLADPEQLQRVLRYVVGNALRHTSPGGSVRVDVRADGPETRVSVSYSGPGPEPQDLERVFDPFYRAEPARSRAPGSADASEGAGLGLALARGLVQAHGGRIWVERSATGGTLFHFTVPFVIG